MTFLSNQPFYSSSPALSVSSCHPTLQLVVLSVRIHGGQSLEVSGVGSAVILRLHIVETPLVEGMHLGSVPCLISMYLSFVHCLISMHLSFVGIQVSCSAEDHSAVRDGRFPVSKYSRTSLYIAGHLPHLDTSSNQESNQATFPSYPSYLLISFVPCLTYSASHLFRVSSIWP